MVCYDKAQSACTHRGRPAVPTRLPRLLREHGGHANGEPMNDTKQHEALWDLIKETRFCMLSHRHTDGSLHSHPLTPQNKTLEAAGCLYCFVARSTEVGQRLQQDG